MKEFLLMSGLLLGVCVFAEARGKEGYLIKGTYEDAGDTIDAFSATVGTTTPVKVFFSSATQFVNYRELMFQNTSTNTYRVYFGTHSAVSASTSNAGGRWFIPAGGSWTTNAKDDLWAIFESAAHGTGMLEVLGEFERDSLDADITDR